MHLPAGHVKKVKTDEYVGIKWLVQVAIAKTTVSDYVG